MDIYTVSIRIIGHSLDMDTISNDLDLEPTAEWRGGFFRAFSRKPGDDVWEFEFGSEELPKQWDTAEEGLRTLMEHLHPRRKTIAAYQKRYKVCLWCGYFSHTLDGGPSFSPALLKELGEFAIPVELHCFLLDQPD